MKTILISILLLIINLLFFPSYVDLYHANQKTGETVPEINVIYLAPIWTKSYSSHFFSLASSEKKYNTSEWMTFEKIGENGKKLNSLEAFNEMIEYEKNYDGNKKAYGVWTIFFCLPSLLIISLSFLFFKHKNSNKSDQIAENSTIT